MRALLPICFFLSAVLGRPLPAAESIPLWPDKPPQFLENAPAETTEDHGSIRNVTVPSLTPFLPPPDKRTAMAIIVCAGGGYGALDWRTHVEYAAQVFTPKGVAILGLKYRLRPPHKLDNAGIQALTLLDAKRAVRLVRHRAAEWGIDPHRIGVAGYSAGGNLSMNLAANFDAGTRSRPIPLSASAADPTSLSAWPPGTGGRRNRPSPSARTHRLSFSSTPPMTASTEARPSSCRRTSKQISMRLASRCIWRSSTKVLMASAISSPSA